MVEKRSMEETTVSHMLVESILEFVNQREWSIGRLPSGSTQYQIRVITYAPCLTINKRANFSVSFILTISIFIIFANELYSRVICIIRWSRSCLLRHSIESFEHYEKVGYFLWLDSKLAALNRQVSIGLPWDPFSYVYVFFLLKNRIFLTI